MQIDTAFGPGEKGWVYYGGYVRQLTVGMVRAILVQSDGESESFYQLGNVKTYTGGMGGGPDNYAPQSSYTEEYMCVETGVGSGNVWTLGTSIFKTKEECEVAAADAIERKRIDDEEAAKWRAEQRRREYDSALTVVKRYEASQATA